MSPPNQCLVVCQICHSPPCKSWNYSKMVDHLKDKHQIEDISDAERLASDWLTDASRGRPRYPEEIIRRFVQKEAIEGLAEALGFIVTSADRELCGVTKHTEVRSRKRKADPTTDGFSESEVGTTCMECSDDVDEITIDEEDCSFDRSSFLHGDHSLNYWTPNTPQHVPQVLVLSQADATLAWDKVDPLLSSPRKEAINSIRQADASVDAVSTTGILMAQKDGAEGEAGRLEQQHSISSRQTNPPPGWDLSRIKAAHDAWSKSVVFKVEREATVTTEGVRRIVYWRLCPHCGVPKYEKGYYTGKRLCCLYCDTKDSNDIVGLYVKSGWRPIPPSMWAWIKSHFQTDPKVLAEVAGLLRDFGVVATTDHGVDRLGGEAHPSSEKKIELESTRPQGSFNTVFPLVATTNKVKRTDFLCPFCDTVATSLSHITRKCSAMRDSCSETKGNVVISLIEQKRIVISSSKLQKLMSITKGRENLRSAVAAVLCSIGSVVLLDDTVMSPWEFLSEE